MLKTALAISIFSLFVNIALADSVPKPDPEAAYFAQESKLAAQGNAAAEDCLSSLYANGLGTARDLDKMNYWAKTAAATGSEAGQLDVAKSYAWGVGVKADPKKALVMIQALVAKGYAPAETTLGILYVTGTGVTLDKAEAVRWITKAAEDGDFEGQIRLGSFYHWGGDVKADPVESQKWLDKAARHKIECAADYFFQMPFLVNAYLDPKAISAKEERGRLGIKFSNDDGKAVNIVVFQPSGSQSVDDAWVEAARKAKLPLWPETYHTDDKVSGFSIQGTYEGLAPGFATAVKEAIDDAKQFPKDALVNGSKGSGVATVSFDYSDGKVSGERITNSSGDASEDTAALAAVANAKYPATPEQYKGMHIPMSINVKFGVIGPAGPTTIVLPSAATH